MDEVIGPIPNLWNGLTGAEQEIAWLVRRGLRDGEIARSLSIDSNVVKDHIRSIYGKLDLTDRLGLVFYIARHEHLLDGNGRYGTGCRHRPREGRAVLSSL